MSNHGTELFRFNTRDRVAQLILEKIDNSEAVKVKDLNVTEQRTKGFGSTGTKSLMLTQQPENTDESYQRLKTESLKPI